MSQQNIYPIQLLNDLHNYFPDVLYNPGRFRNIQDLLDYIRQVADMNPFTRGLNIYNNRQMVNMRPANNIRNTYPPAGPMAAGGGGRRVGVGAGAGAGAGAAAGAGAQQFENNITTARIRVPVTTLNGDNTNIIMNTLLGGMFGDLFGTTPGVTNLQTFLNNRVVIHPTNEEIANGSTLYIATERQDDNCAICQDLIETNQEVRKLNHCNHYFHSECIDTWFQGNVLCPTCRHDIREVETNIPPATVLNNREQTDINRNT